MTGNDFRTTKLTQRVFGTILLALAAFTLTATPTHAVINGEFDEDNAFSNVGAIVGTKVAASFPNVEPPAAISSGILIHPRVLLTAGHSVQFLNALANNDPNLKEFGLDAFVVSFAPDVREFDDEGKVPVSFAIQEALIHPDFTNRQADPSHDIGVVILKEAVPGDIATPAGLPRIGLLDDLADTGDLAVKDGVGTPVMVVGYGATEESEGTDTPFTVQALASNERHIGISEFQSLRRNELFVSRQSSQSDEVGGPAAGDSGGPLYALAENDDGKEVLMPVAVVSWGDNVAIDLAVNARIDVVRVQEWVTEQFPSSE